MDSTWDQKLQILFSHLLIPSIHKVLMSKAGVLSRYHMYYFE